MIVGAKGTGRATMPVRLTYSPTLVSWAKTNAITTHDQSAPPNCLAIVSKPMSASSVMSAYAANRTGRGIGRDTRGRQIVEDDLSAAHRDALSLDGAVRDIRGVQPRQRVPHRVELCVVDLVRFEFGQGRRIEPLCCDYCIAGL